MLLDYMNTTKMTFNHEHKGPNPGVLALVYAALFIASLCPVLFGGGSHIPVPFESREIISSYFQSHSTSVMICGFLQFGAAVPLGIYTATMVSRLQFLGVRAAGVYITLLGGFMTVWNMALAGLIAWVLAEPGMAHNAGVASALYLLVFAVGGVGFSVPFGLMLAGICVTSAFRRLLPRWIIASGLVLALIAELSFFALVIPKAAFLIPLTRVPGFIWVALAGFYLPKALARQEAANPV
jgi:hypothetical protein